MLLLAGTAAGGRWGLQQILYSQVAGKTGTSRDGWFVGYTPNLVCVVWIGFDDNQQLGLTGAAAALPAVCARALAHGLPSR